MPEDRIYVSDEKTLIEVARRLPALRTIWLLMPTPQSFENRVIQKMATTERWQALRTWRPSTFNEYLAIATQEGLTISHHEPRRIFLKGPILRQWLESELAPRLKLDPWDYSQLWQ